MKKFVFISPLFLLIIFTKCAQVVQPTGGKKDTIAPKVVESFPKNQTKNYKGKIIKLLFDEYIVEENISQQLLITPEIQGTYTSKTASKSIVLAFEKPFRENTTYSLNFRNGIRDFSEKNPAKNVKIVFSTGSNIDSLSISGKIKNHLNNQPILDATVGLYIDSDSLTIKKHKPYYFTKTDSSGIFKIENIKVGSYQLYAMIDKNSNLLWDIQQDYIGFLTDKIILNKNLNNINLSLVKIDSVKQKVNSTKITPDQYSINYKKGITKFYVIFDNPKDSLAYMQVSDKDILFFRGKTLQDTTKISITVSDSLGQLFNHQAKITFKAKNKKSEKDVSETAIKSKPSINNDIEANLNYEFIFSKPIERLSEKYMEIHSADDSSKTIPIEQFIWNNTHTNLKIFTKKITTEAVDIVAKKGAFISIEQDTVRSFKQSHKIKIPENYGLLSGKVTGIEKGFIVQLIDKETKQIVSEQSNTHSYTFDFVKTGIYIVRVVLDQNFNNRWDFGDPIKKIQPERIVYYMNDIKVKQNFEFTGIDFDISLENVNLK